MVGRLVWGPSTTGVLGTVGRGGVVTVRIVRAGIASAAIWLLVVAAGSSFAWVAINQAGENLVAVDAPSLDEIPDPAAGPLPILPVTRGAKTDPVPSPSQPRVADSASVAPSSQPSAARPSPAVPKAPQTPTAPARPTSSSTPAVTSKPTSAKPTSAQPRQTRSTPRATGSSSEQPRGASNPTAPSVRTPAVTASGGAGVVTVACQGSVVRVRSVTPRSGWTARVYRRETIAAVSFHREGHSTGFVLFIGCVSGAPRIVSTPRGVTVEPRAIRQVLDDHTFVQIANRLDWRAPFGNAAS